MRNNTSMWNNVTLKCQFPHRYLPFVAHSFLPFCCCSLPPLVQPGVPEQLKVDSTQRGCRERSTAGGKTHHRRFLQFFFRFGGTCCGVNKERCIFYLMFQASLLSMGYFKIFKNKSGNELYTCASGSFGTTASHSFVVFYNSRQQSHFTFLRLNFRPTFLVNVLYFGKKIIAVT